EGGENAVPLRRRMHDVEPWTLIGHHGDREPRGDRCQRLPVRSTLRGREAERHRVRAVRASELHHVLEMLLEACRVHALRWVATGYHGAAASVEIGSRVLKEKIVHEDERPEAPFRRQLLLDVSVSGRVVEAVAEDENVGVQSQTPLAEVQQSLIARVAWYPGVDDLVARAVRSLVQ